MDGRCDVCLRAVRRAARHCETCSASLCASHLEEHAEAPESSAHETVQLQQARAQAAAAPANQGPPPQRRGADVSWLWQVAVPVSLMVLAVSWTYFAPKYFNTKAPPSFLQQQQQQHPTPAAPGTPPHHHHPHHPQEAAEAERLRAAELQSCCQSLFRRVEAEKRRMAERMCHMQERVEEKTRAVRGELEAQRRMLLQALQDEELQPYAHLVMAAVESSNNMLLDSLDKLNHKEALWCNEVRNITTAMAY